RATVLRGHCHAPHDEQGLKAWRQWEKPPSLALPEGLGDPWDPEGPPLEFLRRCYGGSFLVHKSLPYKQEKALGEKVYWTCRDHALHSCLSRAITQEQGVTVMRGYCYPPDVEGLEARQQQKAMETLQAMQDMDADPGSPEFLRSPLGGSFLVYESFFYRQMYWTCWDQARMGCRSCAITWGQRVMVLRSHCHQPDLEGIEALRQWERLPSMTQQEDPEKIQVQ
ncbi:hypothetical protein EGM_10860, partial [Macaca fascicularis]